MFFFRHNTIYLVEENMSKSGEKTSFKITELTGMSRDNAIESYRRKIEKNNVFHDKIKEKIIEFIHDKGIQNLDVSFNFSYSENDGVFFNGFLSKEFAKPFLSDPDELENITTIKVHNYDKKNSKDALHVVVFDQAQKEPSWAILLEEKLIDHLFEISEACKKIGLEEYKRLNDEEYLVKRMNNNEVLFDKNGKILAKEESND